MSDVVIDDLIKNDKTKKKTQLKAKKDGKPTTGPRRRATKPSPTNAPNKVVRGRDSHPQPFKKQNRPLDVPRERSPLPEAQQEPRKLRIIGLHPNITSNDLFEMFNKLGPLDVCKVDQDNFGRSLTTATVIYHSPSNAQQAQKEFNNHKIMNSTISVEFAKPRQAVQAPTVPRTKKIFKRVEDRGNNSGFRGENRPFRGDNRRGAFRGKRGFRGNRN